MILASLHFEIAGKFAMLIMEERTCINEEVSRTESPRN